MSVKIPQYDDRGVLDKLSSGDLRAIDGGDLAHAGKFVLDTAGNIETFTGTEGLVGNSTAIGVGLRGVINYYAHEDERARIAENFGRENLRQLMRQNPALKRRLEKGVDWTSFFGHAAASLGGAALGGSAATLLTVMFTPLAPLAFPVLLAGVGGAVIGGSVANNMYSRAFDKQEQDPILINMQINKIYAENGYVPPEIVFAAMAANLPEKSGKRVDKLLDKYADTKSFTVALNDHNNIPKLAAMMHDQTVDIALRREYRIPPDPENPMKTVAEQYAEMINSGYMRPQDLLNKNGSGYIRAMMAKNQEQGIEVPVTPDARQNSVGRSS